MCQLPDLILLLRKIFPLRDFLNKTASLSQLPFHEKPQTKPHKTPTHHVFGVDRVIQIKILNRYIDHLAEWHFLAKERERWRSIHSPQSQHCTCSSDLQQKLQCELWSCLIFLPLFSKECIEHAYFSFEPLSCFTWFLLAENICTSALYHCNELLLTQKIFLKVLADLEKSKNISFN